MAKKAAKHNPVRYKQVSCTYILEELLWYSHLEYFKDQLHNKTHDTQSFYFRKRRS